jgi:predicted dehydrogenase
LASRELPFRVASWWEFVSTSAWSELNWPSHYEFDISEVRISAPGPAQASWKTRSAQAAGGVLADSAAYSMLEALVATRGLPESVSACGGSYRRTMDDGTQAETEDTAVALLRYHGGGLAWIRATWNAPPFEQVLVHHGEGLSVSLTDQQATLMDGTGAVLDTRPLPPNYLAEELARFADQVAGQARERSSRALERHLAVSALLEATYLAARTNQPESPRKLYEVMNLPEPQW